MIISIMVHVVFVSKLSFPYCTDLIFRLIIKVIENVK